MQKVDNIEPWPRCTYGSYWVIGDATSEDHTKAFEKCSRQNINPEKGNRGGDGGRGGNAGTPGDIFDFLFSSPSLTKSATFTIFFFYLTTRLLFCVVSVY